MTLILFNISLVVVVSVLGFREFIDWRRRVSKKRSDDILSNLFELSKDKDA